ncbi:hypothetical protein N9Z27_01965 [Alphaproteobacteria bacterium]|nr:hypothetical protein [Alphaproteobacteria bacterium]
MTDFLNTIDITVINTDPFLLFFGCFYLVLGLSIFFAAKSWHEFIELFVEHDSISLILGILTLPIALFVVFFYNNWDSLASIVLMSMGYISMAKACILLLRPPLIQNFVKKEYIRKYLWVDGVSGIVLATALLIL